MPAQHHTECCTDDCTIDTISLIGVRGGSGTSTMAAVLSLFASKMVGVELVTEDVRLTSALLGFGEPDESPANVAPGLILTTRSSETAGLTVIDGGTLGSESPAEKHSGERRIGVLRGPCYLALRALMAAEYDLDGLILVSEPGRALNVRDVADVTGLDVLAVVAATPAVSRIIDAGLLVGRHHKLAEFRPLRLWLTLQLDPFPPRRSATRSPAPNHPSMSGTDLLLPPSAKVAVRPRSLLRVGNRRCALGHESRHRSPIVVSLSTIRSLATNTISVPFTYTPERTLRRNTVGAHGSRTGAGTVRPDRSQPRDA